MPKVKTRRIAKLGPMELPMDLKLALDKQLGAENASLQENGRYRLSRVGLICLLIGFWLKDEGLRESILEKHTSLK